MNKLVELILDPCKLKFNEELLKYIVQIVEKTKNPPIIITCIGKSSYYNEYTVGQFLTCIKSSSDFTIIDVNESQQDRENANGIKLLKEIYRKNGNSAEDLAIFVLTLSQEKTENEKYFNQLAAFASIISSLILQTDFRLLWKDTDGRVSKWIEIQEQGLNKKAQVAYSHDFCKFGEEIFTNELVGNVSPRNFEAFLQFAAKLVETDLYPILNSCDRENKSCVIKLENDVDMLDQELGDGDQNRDKLISTKKENLTFSENSGSTVNINLQPRSFQAANAGAEAKQNFVNSNSNQTVTGLEEMEFDNQPKSINQHSICQALVKTKISISESKTEHKVDHIVEAKMDHQINHKKTQTEQNFLLMPSIDDRLPLIIMTKNPGFHKQFQDLIIANIYTEIEKKVKEIHYSNIDHLLSNFKQISNETLAQVEVYQPEKDQNHTLVMGQNLLPTSQIFLEKFQNSDLFQSWRKVFTALEMLYARLSQDFLENMKKLQDLNFHGWDLSKWSDCLMSKVCKENELNMDFFNKYTYKTMGFGKVLKNFQDINQALCIYNDEAKNYFNNDIQYSVSKAQFEDQFSTFIEVSVSKAELDENFMNFGEYFPQIMTESVKIRNQVHEKIYLEYERNMLENCLKFAKCMKTKFESKMNEFFPNKSLSTLKQIKSVANEFRTFCTEFFSAKFQLQHDGVSKIWQNFELDMEDVVRNTILKIDAFGDELERDLFTIETSTCKLAESKASSLTFCQNESASHFNGEISKKSNLHFDDRIRKIMQNIEASFPTYHEKYESSPQAQANSSQILVQDPLNVNESQNNTKEINVCINFGYHMIQILFISDKNGKINLDKPCGKSLKNQIGLDSQGLLCFGKKADNLKNKIHGSEILNPDIQFVHDLGGTVKLSKLELLALILKHIKKLIENQNPVQIKKCILVVPTFLSMSLKSVLKMSAKIAGLHDVEILSESLSAAIYYYYAIFEKKNNSKQKEPYLLMNKVERTQVESWLFLIKKDELQMREQVNCAMLQDFSNIQVHSSGQLKASLTDEEIFKMVKNSNNKCLKGYESRLSTRLSTWHSISWKNILYTHDENIKKLLKYDDNVNLQDHTALFGGIIWANKNLIEDSNLKNLRISTTSPHIINISTLNENFSRSLKLYNEFYHEPSKWNSLSLKTIGNKGGKNFKFNISEVIATDAWKIRKIVNRIQLECEITEEDEITWNFDRDGTLDFFFLAKEPNNKHQIPIQSTWIFGSIHTAIPLDDEYLKISSQQVEKLFSGELNEIFEERKGLQELMEKSKADIKSKKDLNQTLKGRLEDIFKEIVRALDNEKSSKDHLKELKERLEKYNKILSK